MTVRLEKRGAIAQVTFDRPEARNAFTQEMYSTLFDICGDIGADDAIRVVVFQGSGNEAFVSGSDIRKVGEIRGLEDALVYEKHVERTIAAAEIDAL